MLVPFTPLTSQEILKALAHRHADSRQWLYGEEVRIGTGFTGPVRDAQRIDAFAWDLWPSHNHARVAYEIKVSRSDWQRELAKPEKRKAALDVSNQFYFAVPAGMVGSADLPPECGLLWVRPNATTTEGTVRIIQQAPWRTTSPPPASFLASFTRTFQRRADDAKRQLEDEHSIRRISDRYAAAAIMAVTSRLGRSSISPAEHAAIYDALAAWLNARPGERQRLPSTRESRYEARRRRADAANAR